MHVLNHKGKHFKVRGPLNIPRSPQGYPVIVQAGTSDDGMDVAARFAEVIFTANLTMESCQQYFKEIKTRAAGQIRPQPGSSQGDAGAELLYRPHRGRGEGEIRIPELADASGRGARDPFHRARQRRSEPYDFDGPLPDNLPMSNASQSTFKYVTELAKKDNLTMRQIAQVVAGARAKMVMVRHAEEIADHMEQWYVEEAADGFNIMPPYLPGALDDFVELVIPELQRRGLFRTEYTGRTLREHLGLPRPAEPLRQAGG